MFNQEFCTLSQVSHELLSLKLKNPDHTCVGVLCEAVELGETSSSLCNSIIDGDTSTPPPTTAPSTARRVDNSGTESVESPKT